MPPGPGEQKCIIEGCPSRTAPRYKTDYCHAHRRRFVLYGDPLAVAPAKPPKPRRPKPVCAVDGCVKPAHARGWCNVHYNRWHATGDPMTEYTLPHGPVEERIWRHVDRSGDCWLWTSALSKTGYATIFEAGTMKRAHRVMYEMLVGPIPDGLSIDHLCRVKHCVNPEHLEPVTLAENTRRAKALVTHCPLGHEKTPDNVYVSGNRRSCKQCARLRRQERQAGGRT